MDQETARHIAELRHDLGQLRSALGAGDPDRAEAVLQRIVQAVENQAQTNENQSGAIQALTTAAENQAAKIAALIAWGQTDTPPFRGS